MDNEEKQQYEVPEIKEIDLGHENIIHADPGNANSGDFMDNVLGL